MGKKKNDKEPVRKKTNLAADPLHKEIKDYLKKRKILKDK